MVEPLPREHDGVGLIPSTNTPALTSHSRHPAQEAEAGDWRLSGQSELHRDSFRQTIKQGISTEQAQRLVYDLGHLIIYFPFSLRCWGQNSRPRSQACTYLSAGPRTLAPDFQ